MWVFKSTPSSNYVKYRNHTVCASFMFTAHIGEAMRFSTVPAALRWLQVAVMENVNDCWLQDMMPLERQSINGGLTLCEVEEYTPPKRTQWREKGKAL